MIYEDKQATATYDGTFQVFMEERKKKGVFVCIYLSAVDVW